MQFSTKSGVKCYFEKPKRRFMLFTLLVNIIFIAKFLNIIGILFQITHNNNF